MSKIDQLVKSYSSYIETPWRTDVAAAQRVIFCVYNEKDERFLRAKIYEFEDVTFRSGHDWFLFDLTDTFANWLIGQRYAKGYFKEPDFLDMLMHRYLEYIKQVFEQFIKAHDISDSSVIALKGVGSLFGFLKVRDVVDELAPLVAGRLLFFFPGNYENNNYYLLNGHDGWNYLAVPITADKEF